ncbi:putative ABC transport system permease protein [Chitinophaga skermanii]|uniref:Putative ABC transport system permease protein n=1 Tax=Chitinophaga skermanii TaxID=331697 RepID=A0A327Q619_9BACT|nr:ABC transporter permease [Chitinophaga skermanii]RAI98652.1 putative ABC transport system permease protein [Chitinophaga skermanii]
MLKHYFRVAWRSIRKHAFFSFVNVTGLAIAMGFVMLMAAFIWSECTVNKNLKNSDRTYIILNKWKTLQMGPEHTSLNPLGRVLMEQYPNLVAAHYHNDGLTSNVSNGDIKHSESLQPGDASLLKMFGFNLLHGDVNTALDNPNGIVITEEAAMRYFQRTDVVGKTLNIQEFAGNKKDFEITGVLKKMPFNTITNASPDAPQIFFPLKSLEFFGRKIIEENWNLAIFPNYIQLQPGVQPAAVLQAINQLVKTHADKSVQEDITVSLMPVADYYLQSSNGAPLRMVQTLAVVSFFILLMAIINFINITVGNSVGRLREIGVRKTMGSYPWQIKLQFIAESTLIAGFAVLIGVVLFLTCGNTMSDILGKHVPTIAELPLAFVAIPFVLTLLVGVLAGLYPAFVLSMQPTIQSLKGKLKQVREKVALRKSLVVIQFITAIVVFIATIVIGKQVSYFFTSDLGYTKDFIITASVPRDWSTQGNIRMQNNREEFARIPSVKAASYSYEIPNGNNGLNVLTFKSTSNESNGIATDILVTDEKYAATYNIAMAAGDYFVKPGGVLDSMQVVVNEAAAKAYGFATPADAVGQQVKMYQNNNSFTIKGVVKDFHFASLHNNIAPMLIVNPNLAPLYRYFSFKIQPGNTANTINALKLKWEELFPGAPFEYKFIDDAIAKMYTREMQLKKASEMATVIALIIVLLGVIGIVSLSIAKRNKEVGIRKVLGASVPQIVMLFVKDFSATVLIANIVAWPLAYYVLQNWLDSYAYRVNMGIVPFVVVALITACLVMMTVTLLTSKVALTNPVKSIRRTE